MKHTPLSSFILYLITAGVLVFAGCVGNNINDSSATEKTISGTVKISVHLGKVGTLSKRTAIEMDYLVIQIKNVETDSIVLSDTSELSGNEEAIIDKSFPNLSAPDSFTISVTSIDINEEIIHQGSTGFATKPGDTVDLSLDLDALYSMLRVSFNDIPDSIDGVTLMIDGLDTLDSSFTTGTRERIVFEYDYLEADAEGIEYDLSLRASGSFYGNDTVLYAADTTIVAISGVDTNFQIVLKWVGPDIPRGAAEFTVTIGSIGTTSINTEFESIPGTIPANGLTTYFPFNGNADDESGNGIDGTIHGADLTSDRFGRSNAAYSFNGTSDYIDLGTANPVTGNHFTISAWISLGDTVAYSSLNGWYVGTVIFKGSYYNQKGYGLQLGSLEQNQPATIINSQADFIVSTTGDTTHFFNCSPQNIFQSQKWHHIVAILDEQSMKLFIDNKIQPFATLNFEGTVKPDNLPLFIGRINYNAEYESFFKGLIDDIRIYDRALTESEIQALYHENGWTGN